MMSKIDNMLNRVVSRKHDLANQHIVVRLNREAENKRIDEIEMGYAPVAFVVFACMLVGFLAGYVRGM